MSRRVAVCAALVLGAYCANVEALSGRVVDANGAAVPGARVFAEPGLTGAVAETKADADGRWHFDGVLPEAPVEEGPVGVFAIAEGFAFGGTSVDAASPDSELTIQLQPRAVLVGKVLDAKKHPVKGARVTRVGLLGATKVSIPLAKLKAIGIEEPVSDDAGRLAIPGLPAGSRVVLKVAHPDYAQEAVTVDVGGSETLITLSEGVLVQGEVLLRGETKPVSGVTVIIRNAQPPYDTALTQTSGSGAFALRLKPGSYVYQAMGPGFRSPGWIPVTISDAAALARLNVRVSETGRVRGKVCDAASGAPIPGAKVRIETQGNPATTLHAGATGEFTAAIPEGEDLIRVDAAPGYLPPEPPAIKIQVARGTETTAPTFWLTPIPIYTVQVVDPDGNPAPGVAITVLRPAQFGWRVTDAQGQAAIRLASLPSDGVVLGMAESPTRPWGALFAVKREDAASAKVQLLPFGTVTGKIVKAGGKPVEGVEVLSDFQEGGVTLWRTVTADDGTFQWESTIPLVAQRISAYAGEKRLAQGAVFHVDPGGAMRLEDLTVSESAPARSLKGKPLPWFENRVLSGTLPDRETCKTAPAVVAYCAAVDAPVIVDALAHAGELFADKGFNFVVVVDGSYAAKASPIPVLSGKPLGSATTYVTGPGGIVALETFGMPPLRALQSALAAQ